MPVRYLGTAADLRAAKHDATLIPWGVWFYAYPVKPAMTIHKGELVTRVQSTALNDKVSVKMANLDGSYHFFDAADLRVVEEEPIWPFAI